MESIKGKTVIVTGGGTGIGKSIALGFANQGANVVICGRRASHLEDIAKLAILSEGRILAVPADVSNKNDVENVISKTLQSFNNKIDILINNAGIAGEGYIHEHDIDLWDFVMAVNLKGPFLMCRGVLPIMRSQGSGHIINISSEAGLEYYQGYGVYSISKHALNALGEIIQKENQDFGIHVNTICPGMVVTEMTQDSENLIHENSLYPDDIADLVIFLVTRRSNVKIARPLLIQTMKNPWS